MKFKVLVWELGEELNPQYSNVVQPAHVGWIHINQMHGTNFAWNSEVEANIWRALQCRRPSSATPDSSSAPIARHLCQPLGSLNKCFEHKNVKVEQREIIGNFLTPQTRACLGKFFRVREMQALLQPRGHIFDCPLNDRCHHPWLGDGTV